MSNEERSCIKFIINYEFKPTVNNMDEAIKNTIVSNANNAINISNVEASPSLSNFDIKSSSSLPELDTK